MANCICQGNWQQIVSEYEHLIGREYRYTKNNNIFGKIWTFFGIVHGHDDYYYGMMRDGKLRLLSCVSDIEGHGFKLID